VADAAAGGAGAMTAEITNHTRGIWRSFVLFTEEIPPVLLKDLELRHIPHSWQRYYEWAKPHHISLRVEFVDEDELNDFRKAIANELDKWNETSWDEEELTKRSYEFGTHIYRIYRDYYMSNSNLTSKRLNLFLGAFHGFFNELGYDYQDEVNFYIQTAARVFHEVPSLTWYLRTQEAAHGGEAE
jgi:hypothetical protein